MEVGVRSIPAMGTEGGGFDVMGAMTETEVDVAVGPDPLVMIVPMRMPPADTSTSSVVVCLVIVVESRITIDGTPEESIVMVEASRSASKPR